MILQYVEMLLSSKYDVEEVWGHIEVESMYSTLYSQHCGFESSSRLIKCYSKPEMSLHVNFFSGWKCLRQKRNTNTNFLML